MTNTNQTARRCLVVSSSVEGTPTEGTEADRLPLGGSVFSQTRGVQRASLPLWLIFSILQLRRTGMSKPNVWGVAHSGTLHTTHTNELRMDHTHTMSMK